MQKEELYSDSKKEALYERLLTSLEERGKKIHVIYPDFDSGEKRKEAKERYIKETGAFIGPNDIVIFVIYDDHLQTDE